MIFSNVVFNDHDFCYFRWPYFIEDIKRECWSENLKKSNEFKIGMCQFEKKIYEKLRRESAALQNNKNSRYDVMTSFQHAACCWAHARPQGRWSDLARDDGYANAALDPTRTHMYLLLQTTNHNMLSWPLYNAK